MKCKACGTEIFFIKTDDGKKIPVNKKPGIFYVKVTGSYYHKTFGHLPHWVVCTNNDKFRKNKGPRKTPGPIE